MSGVAPERASQDTPNALPWRVDKLLPTQRNAARCARCFDIVESTYNHDFRACRCGAIFVDGGKTCPRAGGDLINFAPLDEWRVMGWYSHRWKALRAIRRAFGASSCRVVEVPGDEFLVVWRAAQHVDLVVDG